MKKRMIAVMALCASSWVHAEQQRTAMEVYDKTCKTCHEVGAAGAPKTGDAAAWAPRLEKGMDALLVSVNKGLNAMPAKGLCFDCSEAEYRSLIEYMAQLAH